MTNSEARNPHATPPTLDALDAIRARYERAHDELDRMTSATGGPGSAWRWSIPANPDRDSDVLLSDSLRDIPLLLAALDKANHRMQILASGAAIGEFARVERDNLRDRLAAAESARDAAEGVVRELRREVAEVRYELGDALTRLTVTEGALREVRKSQDDRREALALYAPGKNHALACHLDAIDDALALAPVTTDETEGGGVDE